MTLHAASARMRLTGSRLRGYREEAGLTIGDAACILGCDDSKISRVETGQRAIHGDELRLLLDKYGAGPAARDTLAAMAPPPFGVQGWWTHHQGVLPDPYLELACAEFAACSALVYAPLQVPELLQAPSYARAAAAWDASLPQAAEHAAVTAAGMRQNVTLDRRRLPVDVVIGEAALLYGPATGDVMSEQLSYLAGLPGRWPHLTIRLLPLTVGAAPAGGAGSFTVLRFGPDPALGVVHTAGPSGGLCHATPQAAGGYHRAFTHLQALSLNPESTARRLHQLARD
jgi:transcriptional regulator with XRE-family HTH domain